MVLKLSGPESKHSGVGLCLAAPEFMESTLLRAASNVAAFVVVPLGVAVNLNRARTVMIEAFKIRENAEPKSYAALKGNFKAHIAFAALDTTVAVALYFSSWKILAIVFIARQLKPDYAILAYKKFVTFTESFLVQDPPPSVIPVGTN